MKDLTPISPFDPLLSEREVESARLGGNDALPSAADGTVSLVSEERMDRKRARYELCAPVANDILEEARASLALRFRFLDRALWHMPLQPSFEIFGLASDGIRLYYDPEYVVMRFKLSPNEVVRDVVHCLFHCVFRHPFMLYSVVREPWDIACDIAVESLLLELLGDAYPCNYDRRQKDALRILRTQLGGVITAERLYRFFAEEGNRADFRSLAPIFSRDTHGLWYGDGGEVGRDDSGIKAGRQASEAEGRGPSRPDVKPSDIKDDLDDLTGGDGDGPSSESSSAGEANDAGGDEETASQWQDISEQMQVQLETAIIRKGEGAGSLIAALKAVNREMYDYGEFLKRFAVLRERAQVNPDEFDYIYYMFGLERYGNMPLIEPLEYKESRVVSDFVIAIDTSGSCSGELVQAFVRKTYNILAQSQHFHHRVNVHVIQCDACIQEDTKLESLEQLDLYLESMELKGFGGTDFRPVFEYVNMMVEKGEFNDLRGLVYFTDGQGDFPTRAPSYDALFVFLDDGYTDPPVPPWALKVLLDDRELMFSPAQCLER